jgi:arsenate reductase (glutaredoxin)
MEKINLYGLPNCDTTRAAIKWFKDQKIQFQFTDYRKDPVTTNILKQWLEIAGIHNVLNKKSKTWRELTSSEQSKEGDTVGLIDLLRKYPALIKRPVLEINGTILTGFREDEYLSLIKPG